MCPRSIVYCFKIKVKRYFNLKLFVCLFIFGIICFRFNVLLCVYSIFLSLHVIHCTNSRIVEVLLLFHQQRWVWRKKGKANIGKYYWWKPNKVSAWIKCVCSSACVCVCVIVIDSKIQGLLIETINNFWMWHSFIKLHTARVTFDRILFRNQIYFSGCSQIDDNKIESSTLIWFTWQTVTLLGSECKSEYYSFLFFGKMHGYDSIVFVFNRCQWISITESYK